MLFSKTQYKKKAINKKTANRKGSDVLISP